MNNIMKRKVLTLSLLSALMILSGCSQNEVNQSSSNDGSESTGTTTISFFGWGSAEEQENFQILVDEFMRQNQDVKVVYSATDSDSYMTTLKNKGNNLPDVFYVPDYEFMQWADSGKLLALDEYVEQSEIDSMWDLSTSMYRYDRNNFKLGQGNLYGLPKDLGPYPLVYNKDLLKKIIQENNLDLELPSPDIPMTWDNFVNYLKAITTNNIYGIGYYELMAAVYSNNADYFDENVKNQKITDQNFIDAVQFVADLSTKHKVAPTADEQSSQNSFQRFLNQGCVFTFMGPWDCKQFWEDLTFEFDIVPVPVGPAEGAKSTSWVGSVAYCVSSKSKKKNAAVRLAKFLACSESSNIMNYQLGQAIPNIKEYAENQYVNGEGLTGRQLMPQNRKLFVDIVRGNEYVQGKNRCKYYAYDNTFLEDLDTALNTVYQGNETAESFLKGYANKYQSGLDESNEYLNG
mgnify:CR=1 FL=1